MSAQALVTIAILSYQRREALTRVLESAVGQDYPRLEILVVDNGSEEAVRSEVRKRFPQVDLLELPQNIGTAARNRGILAARGEIVVTLDNDVYLDHPLQVREIVEAFGRHRKAGCIVFRVYHPATGKLNSKDWWHPRRWEEAEAEEFETPFITEGAAAFRREVFQKVGLYWEPLFITHEGLDLSLRLWDAGWEVWYVPSVKVWHMASGETREPWRSFYYSTRNLLPVVYRHYPWAAGLSYLLPRLAGLGFYSLKEGYFRSFLRGLFDGLKMLRAAGALRQPLRSETLRKIARLNARQPGLLARFRRHWHGVEF